MNEDTRLLRMEIEVDALRHRLKSCGPKSPEHLAISECISRIEGEIRMRRASVFSGTGESVSFNGVNLGGFSRDGARHEVFGLGDWRLSVPYDEEAPMSLGVAGDRLVELDMEASNFVRDLLKELGAKRAEVELLRRVLAARAIASEKLEGED